MRPFHRAQKRTMPALQGKGWRNRRPLTRFDDLFQDHPQPMWIYDLVSLRFLRVNAAACRHYGYTESEFLRMTIRDIRPAAEQARLTADVTYGIHVQPQPGTIRSHVKRDGKPIVVRISSHALIYEGRRARLVFALDVTDQMTAERELEHQSTHDALTGLPNRNLFHDRLEQAIAYAVRYGHQLWVVVLDLDNFKLINDTLGHAVGDALLQMVAGRLRSALRESDTVARLGGDEFILLLLDQPAGALTHRTVMAVLEALSVPMRVDAHELALTCSMGVATFPSDGDTGPALFKHADIALYRAKDGGRNQLQFYTSEMNARVTERTLIEGHLRNALVRDEFVLYFQPRIDCASGRVAGLEALLRWRQPELGLVPPDRFIGVAEETGRIVEIGEWVLYEACRQTKAWQDAGLPRVPVAVNVSARQFRQPGFVQEVGGALAASGLDPAYLELELTESLMMQNIDTVIAAMVQLKASGVRLSIDDFGTGYSSLSYLRRFPLDYLKIDRSFVRDMLNDAPGGAIVRSMITLGHSLGCRIIAEGVETSDQLGYLTREGCDEIQGFLCSRPVPEYMARELLTTGR